MRFDLVKFALQAGVQTEVLTLLLGVVNFNATGNAARECASAARKLRTAGHYRAVKLEIEQLGGGADEG